MKVRITNMKAPWPEGAELGQVVEIKGDEIPGSLAGKCQPYDGDEKAAHSFAPKAPKAVNIEPSGMDKSGAGAAKALAAMEGQIKALTESLAKANEVAASLVAALEAASKKEPAK
jgi:hypothetical protein